MANRANLLVKQISEGFNLQAILVSLVAGLVMFFMTKVILTLVFERAELKMERSAGV